MTTTSAVNGSNITVVPKNSGTQLGQQDFLRLMTAQLSQQIHECIVDLLGADGTLHEAGYPMTRSDAQPESRTGRFLRSRANTIEGGTSEIMRNILGERVLGLPGDVRVDKDVAWSEIPR